MGTFVTKKKYKQETDEMQQNMTKDIISQSTHITQKAVKDTSK
jgi:hypothetical protein